MKVSQLTFWRACATDTETVGGLIRLDGLTDAHIPMHYLHLFMFHTHVLYWCGCYFVAMEVLSVGGGLEVVCWIDRV